MNKAATSLVLLALAAFVHLAGCADSPDGVPTSSKSTTTDHGHAHPSEGPHGGELIELGNDEFHAELVHPHDHGDDAHARDETDQHVPKEGTHDHTGITIFILDGSAKKTVPIDAAEVTLNLSHDGKPAQFKLAAMPSDNEPQGKSSRFASTDKDLLEHVHEKGIEGTLVLSINGKSYRGKILHKHGDEAHPHADGHKHTGDDALVWRRTDIEHNGYKIRLGHHGTHLHAGAPVEPAVSIERDGQPVDQAQVFNSLVTADGQTVVADEVRTVYEPPTTEEPAHYAQGGLSIPAGTERILIRYRLKLPGPDDEVTIDVAVDIEGQRAR